jgi:hypothetical protein
MTNRSEQGIRPDTRPPGWTLADEAFAFFIACLETSSIRRRRLNREQFRQPPLREITARRFEAESEHLLSVIEREEEA